MIGADEDFQTYKFDSETGVEEQKCIVCREILYNGPKKSFMEKFYDGDLTCKNCGTNNW